MRVTKSRSVLSAAQVRFSGMRGAFRRPAQLSWQAQRFLKVRYRFCGSRNTFTR